MDIISFNEAATANGRIEIINANPDSTSGIVTVPKTIASGETVTIPAGRVAVLPNVQVDGELNVEGDVFIPAGATFGDLESQIALKADTSYVNNKYSGFKNYIINGGFDVWQRGTSGFSGQNYGADRWLGSTGVENYSRQNADSLGGYYARITRTSASTGSLVLSQRIEQINVKDLKGKILTLSFYTRQTSGTTIPINVYIYTPTIADNYTSATLQQTISALSNPTSTFQKVSISFTVSETMALNGFSITIGNLTAGTSSIDISQVQLEEGSVATPFEQRPIGLELSLCRRYYTQAGAGATGIEETASRISFGIKFDTPMRTPPTIVVNTTVSWRLAGYDRLDISVSVDGGTTISDSGIWLYLIDNSNGSVAGRPIINRTATNFIRASAEL